MRKDDIFESIMDLCRWSYTGFVLNNQQWNSFDKAMAEINDDTDWNTFLYTLTQYEGWSTRKRMWKLLRDIFAPDYKKWLRQKKQEATNRQLTLFDIFDKEEQDNCMDNRKVEKDE